MLPKHINKDCRKFREMISPYIDSRLSQDEKKALELHLVSCRDCREEWESLHKTVGLLHRLPQVEVPRSFTVVESKPAVAPSVLGRLCWASAIVAMILVLFSAGDLFQIYPEKSNGPSPQVAVTITATPTSTSTPNIPIIGGGKIGGGPLEGTPTPEASRIAGLGPTLIPGQTDNVPAPTAAPSPVPAANNTAASTEANKEGYRWPVHQIELAVLGIAIIMMAAVIIVWRRGERSSTKG
jgi:hypothetical protein